MKAMILAAGFGTRLLPYTEKTPKPLFPIDGRPLLGIIIETLQQAGCRSIIINTHHLHQMIESFIAEQHYAVAVHTRHEPVILGTGGAIKNVTDFWDDSPFMVINSDIVTDINLRQVYNFHLNHHHPVTLVLHDYPEFNEVTVDKEGFIEGFHDPITNNSAKKLAFTGIHVIDPEILNYIPENVFFNIVDVYEKLIAEGRKIKALVPKKHYWEDIGTPEKYKKAVIEKMVPGVFKKIWPQLSCEAVRSVRLKGDGSDRTWYRLHAGDRSIVIADHGIRTHTDQSEIDSFVAIGCHLHGKGLPVPRIYHYDTFSGLVCMEDLGDLNLQGVIQTAGDIEKIIAHYQSVINLLIKLSISGAEGFDTGWAYQTPYYSRELILEKECRYFVDAFLKGYLEIDACYEDFEDEFIYLAKNALEFSINGFMHRDMQSRNIMIKDNQYYFIDFQGGRIGPLQYDLASLLIDPYVGLPYPVQSQLLEECAEQLSSIANIVPDHFYAGFKYCSITRNLQILGAFSYLSRVKGKTDFEKFIPAAVQTLKYNLSAFRDEQFPRLKFIVNNL
jgi:aminoglycoside/choline kinase family phosphotransferase/dTDP-glucose pyrophosphorylase